MTINVEAIRARQRTYKKMELHVEPLIFTLTNDEAEALLDQHVKLKAALAEMFELNACFDYVALFPTEIAEEHSAALKRIAGLL